MMNCACSEERYYSGLAADADLAELVELFVDELPGRIADLRQALTAGNREMVARLAHQLKGAGGSHGFPQIGLPAWNLEQAAREEDCFHAAPAFLDELAAVCGRVRAGLPAA